MDDAPAASVTPPEPGQRSPRRLSVATGLSTRLWAVAVGLVAVGLSTPLWLPGPGSPSDYPVFLDVTLIALGDATLGAIILRRRPGHLIGWLFLAGGLLGATHLVAGEYASATAQTLSGIAPAALVASIAQFVSVALVAFLFQLYPTGTVLSRRWRLLTWASIAGVVLIAGSMTFDPGPLESFPEHSSPIGLSGAGTLTDMTARLGFLAWFAGLVGGIVCLGIRMRHADGIERRQLAWFFYAAALGVAAVVGMTAFFDRLMESSVVGSLVWGGAGLGLSVAATVAILRYRLYEIDRIVSRTVIYGLVTAVLVGVYVLVAVMPAAVFELESDLLVAGATLVVAAAFGPVRRRVQAVVDRRFNRSRYDAVQVVDRFSGRLRDQVELAEVAADLRGAVAATVLPAHVSLWLRETEPTR